MAEAVVDGFRPIELIDKIPISTYFAIDAPDTSDLTFTNLFMWADYYRTCWRVHDDCLLLCVKPQGAEQPFGLPPMGAGDKAAAADYIFDALIKSGAAPLLKRVGKSYLAKNPELAGLEKEPEPDQDDYVYLTRELIDLPGRRFHKKKNHLNKFLKTYDYEYRPLDKSLVKDILAMQDSWCELKSCAEDPGLSGEDKAIRQALVYENYLNYKGGVILVDGKVEAFALGEALNKDTAVIHIEKANPAIDGLYTAINQMFVTNAWSEMKYINREQDLGLAGLRAAKKSYNPHHMQEKFALSPA